MRAARSGRDLPDLPPRQPTGGCSSIAAQLQNFGEAARNPAIGPLVGLAGFSVRLNIYINLADFEQVVRMRNDTQHAAAPRHRKAHGG